MLPVLQTIMGAVGGEGVGMGVEVVAEGTLEVGEAAAGAQVHLAGLAIGPAQAAVTTALLASTQPLTTA